MKGRKPQFAAVDVGLSGFAIKADSVAQSAGYDLKCRERFAIGRVNLRRHITNVLFDVPNAFAATAFVAKEANIASVSLWIVSADE